MQIQPLQQQPQQQERPEERVFLQINHAYPGLKMIHASPLFYSVENFLTPQDCEALAAAASQSMGPSPVVGAGAGEVSVSRTSSSCFFPREELPGLVAKVAALTNVPMNTLEFPQVGRYYTGEHYSFHFDAFDLGTEEGRRFAQNGGQRIATVLIYLNNVTSGGCTYFPHLGLRVTPRQGMAVVFFPASLDGQLDDRLLHAAEPAGESPKWVSQIWIRQGMHVGSVPRRQFA
ncbi:unnamed protein product [Chrysoparadoxa australica]